MFKKKTPVPTTAEYQAAWSAACAPHVPEQVITVALLNPAGAVAGKAASVAGGTVGGLTGRAIASTVANHQIRSANDRPIPPVLAAVLTASAVHLLEVELVSPDADQLRVVAPFETWARDGLGLTVSRKLMSERLSFDLPGGRRVELDGMFAPRCKERLYQPLIDQLRA
ncbi:hypothetical protein [Aeromicrobium sp. NPDC092404]|uniref:hypothetical protein n=1 Tax=Aeromicrobium sp. NPDC092404 TaxID=3154976 RepID=UPI0034251AC1